MTFTGTDAYGNGTVCRGGRSWRNYKEGAELAASKRQTTFAKMAREQAMREKRVRKQEKKDDKKQAAIDAANGVVTSEEPLVSSEEDPAESRP